MIVDSFYNLKEKISQEKKIIQELKGFVNAIKKVNSADEIAKITLQIDSLKKSLKKINDDIPDILKNLSVKASLKKENTALTQKKDTLPKNQKIKKSKNQKKPQIKLQSEEEKKSSEEMSYLEDETLRRLKKQKKIITKEKEERASSYIQISNKLFSGLSLKLSKLSIFRYTKRDLIKANMMFPQISYISVMLFSSFLSFFIGIFFFVFFLFFNLGVLVPFITLAEGDILARLLKIFWIPLAFPVLTFLILYLYPTLEKRSASNKIDAELPFAAIHMSAISGSMVDPTKIFEILVSTKEYPTISREFIKLINEINIYGYDLVSALKNTAINNPSKKLRDLLNGLATTITSGGNLPEFFEKRASTLLFDYRIYREKEIRASETFMDIYISLVIAAPMILMLLLMMMKISGLGIQLSTNMITLIMVLGVSTINVFFLMFLILKQSSGGTR